jgi:hypothetical protein
MIERKTIDDHFADWEANKFGYGYGTGELHLIPALKSFFGAFGTDVCPNTSYNSETLESAVGSTVAWLLINQMCHIDLIKYGTSPRFGWLTGKGARLKAYLDTKSVEELLDIIERDQEYVHCYPSYCNCVTAFRPCSNPFWHD